MIESEQGRSYQAMLALGALAEAPEFPGCDRGGAVLAAWRLSGSRSTPSSTAAGLAIGKRSRRSASGSPMSSTPINEQVQGAAHGPSVLAGVDRVLAREYEAQLQAGGHPPMLYGALGLAVGADSEEELERRVAALKEQYGDITLHRPAGVQHQLWLRASPATQTGGWLMRDYTQQLTVEQFGALVADREPDRRLPPRPISRVHARPARRCRSASIRRRHRGKTAPRRSF